MPTSTHGGTVVMVGGVVRPAGKRWTSPRAGDEITGTTFDPLPHSVGGANPLAVTRIP
jgi:hypothetical protein